VHHEEVIEAWPLQGGTSAQKAELMALTRALTLGKGKRLNVYTTPNMPSWYYMLMQLYGRKEDSSLGGNPQ
jgi:hypothetical protein